jgi:eukaryotic-like serine/threonine-protein kinase
MNHMIVNLEIIKGPEKGRVISTTQNTSFSFGRAPDNSFVFKEDDPYISRYHFLLEVASLNVYFKDLDVKNPSKINGQYTAETKLKQDDILEIGYSQIRISFLKEEVCKKSKCKECGSYLELQHDETDDQICEACYINQSKGGDEEKRKTESMFSKLPFFCECGKDITEYAVCDGHSQSIQRKFDYLCDDCYKKRKDDDQSTIGDYDILGTLGEGASGFVYLARHQTSKRIVAIKKMRFKTPNLVARFAREVRIMREIEHENSVYCIDSGEDLDGKPFFVMEFASEGNLNTLLLQNSEKLVINKALDIIIQALFGLVYIHKNGKIHRDIKPENILLKLDSRNNLIPKIADFGLAKDKMGISSLTGIGARMGTYFFMPIEQYNDAANVDQTVDIYAMGVTLYMLLTGKYPFNYPSPLEAQEYIKKNAGKGSIDIAEAQMKLQKIQRIQNPPYIVLYEEPIPIMKRLPTLPLSLGSVIDKSMHRDRRMRYQQSHEFLSALQSEKRKLESSS